MTDTEEKRTLQQNKSLHLLFDLIAKSLNEAGYDIIKTTKVMKKGIEIPWSRESVKELLWRFIQKSIYGKHSTTQLNKKEEIDVIYMTLCRFLSERLNIEPPAFPSLEELELKELTK